MKKLLLLIFLSFSYLFSSFPEKTSRDLIELNYSELKEVEVEYVSNSEVYYYISSNFVLRGSFIKKFGHCDARGFGGDLISESSYFYNEEYKALGKFFAFDYPDFNYNSAAPSNKPFYIACFQQINVTPIKCKAGEYFDHKQKKCINKCKKGEFFDNNKKQCFSCSEKFFKSGGTTEDVLSCGCEFGFLDKAVSEVKNALSSKTCSGRIHTDFGSYSVSYLGGYANVTGEFCADNPSFVTVPFHTYGDCSNPSPDDPDSPKPSPDNPSNPTNPPNPNPSPDDPYSPKPSPDNPTNPTNPSDSNKDDAVDINFPKKDGNVSVSINLDSVLISLKKSNENTNKLNTSVDNISNKVDITNSNLKDIKSNTNKLNTSVDNISNKVTITNSNLEDISNKTEKLDTSVDNISNKVDITNSKLEDINNNTNKLNTSVDNISNKVDITNSKLINIGNKLDNSNSNLEAIKNSLDREFDFKPDSASELDSALNEFKSEISKFDGSVEDVKDFLSGLKDSVNGIKKDFDKVTILINEGINSPKIPRGTCPFKISGPTPGSGKVNTFTIDPCRFVSPYRSILTIFFTTFLSWFVLLFCLKYLFNVGGKK